MLEYPNSMIPNFRYRYCPMCKTPLVRKVLFDDNIPLVTCPACHWICTRSNLIAVASVVPMEGGIVTILPPGLPEASPAALPAGLVEYGESPEEAAVREIREETGLKVELVGSLGWFFHSYFEKWPGPSVYFMFEAKVVGGQIEGSDEGPVKIFPLDAFPEIISPTRFGSTRAIRAYFDKQSGLR